MTLNTDWRAVTDKVGLRFLEARNNNDFNLGLLLTVLEVPVIHSETVAELYFRLELFSHLAKVRKETYDWARFERFMGYRCNGGYASRSKWVGRMLKAYAPKALRAKDVWKYYHETGRRN